MRLFYLFGLIAVLTFLWGRLVSDETQLYVGIALLSVGLAYQFLSANRLLKILITDDLMSKPRGLGVWHEIYYMLQKSHKNWVNKIIVLEEQQSQFMDAIQASPNGILVLNELDQIEWCNQVSGRHLGVDAERDILQHITHLLRKPAFLQYFNSRNFRESIELSEMGPQRSKTISLQIFPYGLNNKLLLTQDITQRKQNELMRRDFVANVSHEMKTPLTVMGGFLETIHELPLSEEDRKRYIEIMIAQSNQMRSLIDDLLILSKLESSLPPTSVNVVKIKVLFEMIEKSIIGLSKDTHSIELDCRSEKNIYGDEKEIFSAFLNLVTNAIRYTPKGGKIQIKWTDLKDGGCEFSVQDSGPGIDAKHIPRLTERFYRVDTSRSRDSGGTGLGLAIVKYIVIRHNANLIINSEINKGSLFAIDFPSSRVS